MTILKAGTLNKPGNRGVTLIELCLVGVILSLLFTLSWPVFNHSSRRSQLSAVCSELSATLQYARDAALNESLPHCVEFDESSRSYWIAVKNRQASATSDFVPLDAGLFKKRILPDGIRFESSAGRRVLFYPDGTSQDIEITLHNNQGQKAAVKLLGSTGRIAVSS